MKHRARFVLAPALAAVAAFLLAPHAEASLSRASSAERAIQAPALTLASPASAPEPSGFSLFEGNELAAAAAESEPAPSFHPLAAVSLLDERVQRELAAPLEPSYPKTRIGGLRLFSQPVFLVSRRLSVEVRWGCESFSCGIAEGIGSWLSQDPLEDRDSPNLYGFVGARPHEKTDPLGTCAGLDNVPCLDYLAEVPQFFGDVAVDAAKAGVNVATVGGYGGYQRAKARGELDAGALAGGRAYAKGMANFLTIGWYDTAEDTLNEGGTLGQATGTWAGEASGYTDISEGGTKLGEGDYIEGTGRVVVGTGKIAGWIVGARTGYAKATGKPLMAFGRNIGAQRGVQSNRAVGNAARDAIARREGTSLIEQRFTVTGGERIADVLKVGDETLAIESKVGRTGLSKRVRQELARDVKLLRSGQVDKVRWEFSRSRRTGLVGPNAPLAQKLQELGIEVKIND